MSNDPQKAASDQHLENAQHAVQQGKEQAQKAGTELGAAAVAKAGELVDDLKVRAKEAATDLVHYAQASPSMTDVERRLREEPLKVLLTTFGLGVLVGLILRK